MQTELYWQRWDLLCRKMAYTQKLQNFVDEAVTGTKELCRDRIEDPVVTSANPFRVVVDMENKLRMLLMMSIKRMR